MIAHGGSRTYTAYSGGLATLTSGNVAQLTPVSASGGHVVIWSGAGRLNTVYPHQIISGVASFLYDSNVVARSGVGTISESGYTILGGTPANTIGAFGNSLGGGPLPTVFDVPFAHGLALSLPSGAPGVTVVFSPEINPAIG
jgi:hypothetical protein